MPIYKIKHNETGQLVSFDWHAEEDPTEQDMQDIFNEWEKSQIKPEIATVAPEFVAEPDIDIDPFESQTAKPFAVEPMPEFPKDTRSAQGRT